MKLMGVVSLVAVFISIVGCGVKGDPLPLAGSAEIGYGGPSYRRVMKELAEPSYFIDSDKKKKKSLKEEL